VAKVSATVRLVVSAIVTTCLPGNLGGRVSVPAISRRWRRSRSEASRRSTPLEVLEDQMPSELLLIVFSFNLLYGQIEVVLPLRVTGQFKAGAGTLGVIWTCFGIGAIAGALMAKPLERFAQHLLMARDYLFLGLVHNRPRRRTERGDLRCNLPARRLFLRPLRSGVLHRLAKRPQHTGPATDSDDPCKRNRGRGPYWTRHRRPLGGGCRHPWRPPRIGGRDAGTRAHCYYHSRGVRPAVMRRGGRLQRRSSV
jgi:hypothetical protein